MTMAEIVHQISFLLGIPANENVEDLHIEDAVLIAFRELKRYIKNPEDKSAAAAKASEGADKTPADGSAAPEIVEVAAEAVNAPENTAANNTPEQNETTNESKDET